MAVSQAQVVWGRVWGMFLNFTGLGWWIPEMGLGRSFCEEKCGAAVRFWGMIELLMEGTKDAMKVYGRRCRARAGGAVVSRTMRRVEMGKDCGPD